MSLRQEAEGPQAEQPEFVSRGGAREELSPAAQVGDKRPHVPHSRSPGDLPDYTRAERLLGGQTGRGCHLVVSEVNYPEASSLDSILAKRCVHTREDPEINQKLTQNQASRTTGHRKPGRHARYGAVVQSLSRV